MDWNRAKDIMIVFLLLLNIMLGTLIGINKRKYILSSEREKVIVDVLASNNISMYCKIPSKYSPMKMLELEGSHIDDRKMAEAFLGTEYAPLNMEADGIKRYDYGDRSLIIYENKVIFESGGESIPLESDFKEIKALCDEYLGTLGAISKGFELDTGPYIRADEAILEYRQKIDGTVIYDNYILLAVDGQGIRRIEYSVGKPVGYSTNTREMCSPDEALFSFLKAMKRESADKPQRIVENMDLVYFIDTQGQDRVQASPYYRIYYTETGDPEKRLRLCIVNAYLNTWRIM